MDFSTFDYFKRMPPSEGMIELSSKQVDQLQQVLFGMLKDVDAACRTLGVTYTMSGGSCLGAVRHHGFIPWDDDVDLNMRRSELQKFANGFDRLLGESYVLQLPGRTEKYELGFARVRRKGTVVRSRDDLESDNNCGAYIDIFIVDSAPSNPALRAFHGFGSMALGFIWSCRRFSAHRDAFLSLARNNEDALRAFRVKALLGRLFSFLPVSAWMRMWDGWNGLLKSKKSDYVVIPVGRKHYLGELYKEKDFFPVAAGKFNGLSVPLPSNADAYMRALYGDDYMVPPADEDKERHIVFEFDIASALAGMPDAKDAADE